MKKIKLSEKVIKILGVVISIFGAGLSFLSSWIEDKKLDSKINESVAKALTEQQPND